MGLQLLRSRAFLAGLFFALASPASAERLSFYGTSGLIEMPTAQMLGDGEIGLTSSYVGPTLRNTLTFQLLPRVQGTFRYSVIEELDADIGLGIFDGNRFDRSFDVSFLLAEETRVRPAIVLGLRDFGGTGIYSSEFLVATKTLTPQLRVSAGLGWGRLGERNGFSNPLGAFSDRFEDRPSVTGGDPGGQLDAQAWFRGDVAIFGGLEWQVNDRLTFVAEYSSDTYRQETAAGIVENESPLNVGLSYRFDNGINLGAYYLYGTEVGLALSYVFDPAKPRVPGGQETAPPDLLPRQTVAGQSWNLGRAEPSAAAAPLAQRLKAQGITLLDLGQSGSRASVKIDNARFDQTAQAVGRTARVLANTLDPSVRTFDITLVNRGTPQTTVTIRRDDLEELEYDLEGPWRSLARAEFADAFAIGQGDALDGVYPRFAYRIGPYAAVSLFDPTDPVRYDLGVQLNASFEPRPGLIFSGQLRQPITGTIDEATVRSDSVLPRVRSDAVLYAIESDLEINHLTAEYFFRPGENLFGRVSVGYLEAMFGGVSGELLWYPVNSRLALGVELNYARQRDFDMLFGFQDYDVLTGHASAYYEMGNGYHAQVDVGRYLAGDWGATFTLDREFKNGVRIGGFFTLTDVPPEDFGEGSFDKGIRISIPTSWVTGQPGQGTFINQTIRPVTRDGGARLEVRNRLYGVTRPYRANSIADGWGKYYR